MKYLIPTVAALVLLGCGSQQKEDKTAQQPAAKEAPAPEAAGEVTTPHAATEATTAPEAAAEADTTVEESVEAVTETVEESVETAAESVAETAEKVKEGAASAVEEASAAIEETVAQEPSADGAAVFAQKCASCHGTKAEKPALGKSQVIAGWDAAKTETALRGYIDGTYGGAMKAVMQGQAKALDDAQIKAVAEYVGSL